MKRHLLFFLTTLSLFIPQAFASPFLIGAGIYDITGAAAEIDMMGYAMPFQLDNGIHSRQWARAFIIASPKTNKRIVFVSNDLGMVFQSVKQGVIAKLHEKYGELYNDKNVMLSATHTHAGPGGYAFHTLFNFTIRGFSKQNYDVTVNGIVKAIERAHHNLEPGHIYIKNDTLLNTTKNRSIEAYEKNPEAERAQYAHNTDKSIILLKLVNDKGEAIGEINWHAVHGVSMSNKNKLISGDNKGYASYLFEQHEKADYMKDKTFVAAFAQANEGDASPNIFEDLPDDGACDHFDCSDIKRTQLIGQRQYDKALAMFNTATTELMGEVDYRHQYLDMENQTVQPEFTGGEVEHTCQAAVGYAFGAGTSDGAGADGIFSQGQVEGSVLVNLLRDFIATPTPEMEACQKPKPVLLAVGLNKPAWVPHNMPIQIFKVGKLMIAGVPGEFTTTSGRRLKSLLKETFEGDIDTVAIAGLSNSYAGYITTPEEYAQQNYEGGFTVFGQWTLPAYLQGFKHIAVDMKQGVPSETGPLPEDLSWHTGSLIAPVLFDDTPPFVKFGGIHQDVEPSYERDQVVHAVFWGGHPRNNLKNMESFLEIQHLENGEWKTIAHDWDFNTIYRWERRLVSYSYIHIFWHIPMDAPKGNYRILHHGDYLYGWNQKVYPYEGVSGSFEVN